MTNAEWMIKNGYKLSDLHFSYDNNGDIVLSLNDKILERWLYIPFEDALNRWLDMEHDEKILNDAEKKYLSAVIKPFEDALNRWLDMEHDEKILNDAEKKYLSAVIKPFRDKVDFICKVNTLERCGTQRIDIGFTDESIDTELPIFESGTMYKGMKLGHSYTLEELGL